MIHSLKSAAAIGSAALLSGCGLIGGAAQICHTQSVLDSMTLNSGFVMEDPIRGGVMPEGLTLRVADVREIERRPDRAVCSASMEFAGPRGPLSHHILKANYLEDGSFILQEAVRGYASLPPETGYFSALAQLPPGTMALFEDLSQAPESLDLSPITISAPIEFSVSTDADARNGPIAWSWGGAGVSPTYFAAQHLAAMVALRGAAQ